MAPLLLEDPVTLLKIIALAGAIVLFFRTKTGDKLSRFFPLPFWIYFLSILAGTVGFLPGDSPVYPAITLYVLTAALFLMLIGTPVTDLVRMGPRALLAISLAVITMMLAAFIAYAFIAARLPEDGWKAVGALLGTWVGGSANMLVVKEILQMPDAAYAPLIIVDTFLSYAWMALLVMAAAHQPRVNKLLDAEDVIPRAEPEGSQILGSAQSDNKKRVLGALIVVAAGLFMSGIVALIAGAIAPAFTFLSKTAWALLIASSFAILLALTPMRKLEEHKASSMGQFFLYLVLISIGAKTTFNAALDAPIYMIFGAMMLLLHGILMLAAGKLFRLPLFFLATASQAAVGGPVSAPIVAGVYRPNQAHIGVLMAIFGALMGTYVGVAGGFICKWLGEFIR